MSRNQDRISGTPLIESPGVEESPEQPLDASISLTFPDSSEFVTLPSGGKHYPEGHPLSGVEDVEIRLMTTAHEDILTNQNFLKKGRAIEKLIDALILSPKVRASDLLVGDKTAILIAARISGFGCLYSASLVCENCGKSFTAEFNLNNAKVFKGAASNDVVRTPRGTFSTTLPKSGWLVEFKLLTGVEESYIRKSILKAQDKKEEKQTLITDTVRAMLVSVTISGKQWKDPDSLQTVAEQMPLTDSRVLKEKYREVAPSVEVREAVECAFCEHGQEVEMPFGVGFFWSK